MDSNILLLYFGYHPILYYIFLLALNVSILTQVCLPLSLEFQGPFHLLCKQTALLMWKVESDTERVFAWNATSDGPSPLGLRTPILMSLGLWTSESLMHETNHTTSQLLTDVSG